MARLESNLGYAFKDRKRLDLALTHASTGGGKRVTDNERFEFLGDRVLGLITAERLLQLYPEAVEGDLSPRFHALVDKAACARIARTMEIGPALRLSPGETRAGGREKDGILADACEAVMAAVYLDGGIDAARALHDRFWGPLLTDHAKPAVRDPKSTLQTWAQGLARPAPAYETVRREGPDHAPVFTVEVSVTGVEPERGEGRSRQEAEKTAALAMLRKVGQL